MRYYNSWGVCFLLTDNVGAKWHKFQYRDGWTSATAGGCFSHDSWVKNHQYYLDVSDRNKKGSQLVIHVQQEDVRMKWQKDYTIGVGVNAMKCTNGNNKTKKFSYQDQNTEYVKIDEPFMTGRDFVIEMVLYQGNYVLVPSTFKPGDQSTFAFTVYAKSSNVKGGKIDGTDKKNHPL